jgi:hypothetical protein
VLIDAYKVAHWMNARKLTPEQVAERCGLGAGEIRGMLANGRSSIADDAGVRLSATLEVDADQITASGPVDETAVVMSREELHATRRPIRRDGIHFYNYYSMAGASGRVSPVVLDILCPRGRLPALNNGHLEPAITINLGPGDIHGRWGEELGEATWQPLRSNRGDEPWIVGDSYVEPAYCPHTYSLASDRPARIISYTAASNLTALVEEANKWSDDAFAAMRRELDDARPAALLGAALSRRGYEGADAATAAGLPTAGVAAFLDGDHGALSIDDLRTLGTALGFDYRLLLPAARRHDAVGKTACSVDESRATVRRFRGYTVASMASAPHLPDLSGLFMRVRRPGRPELDLCDGRETHYMVVSGTPSLTWRDADGSIAERRLTADASAWLAPYVAHGWSGDGAVIRLSSGPRLGYLDQFELTNTFAADTTLARGRRSTTSWGYDGPQGG